MTRSHLGMMFGGILLLCATETALAQSSEGYELGLQVSGSGWGTPVQTEDLTGYFGGYGHGVMFAWRASLLNVHTGGGGYSLGAALDFAPLERTRWSIQPIVGASFALVGACSPETCGRVGLGRTIGGESTLSGGARIRLRKPDRSGDSVWLKVLVVSRKLVGWNDEHDKHLPAANGIVIGIALRNDRRN